MFVEPLKRKTTEAIIEAFQKIFKRTPERPEKLASDNGREFDSRKFRKLMKDNGIIFYTTNNTETKCSIVERALRTVKTKIFKYLTYANTFTYINVLDDIVKAYNNSFHRTIQMTPAQVNERNILQVYRSTRKSQKIPVKTPRPKLKIGNYVRISKLKNVFAKGYEPNWREEPFKIKTIVKRNPVVYRLVDLNGEDLEGTFYEAELQKIIFDEHAERAIEKIIKQKGKGKNLQYFVKWRGYGTSMNSWIKADAITSI